MSVEEWPEPDPSLSRDATHSTYAPASTDRSAENPPPGPTVEQTLGVPTDTGAATAKSSTTTKSSGSSS